MERVIQRRNIMAAAAGLCGVAMLSQVRAQVATPQAAEIGRADHPINGAWEWSRDLEVDPRTHSPTPNHLLPRRHLPGVRCDSLASELDFGARSMRSMARP